MKNVIRTALALGAATIGFGAQQALAQSPTPIKPNETLVQAAYYVSTTGNDANNGSSGSPYKTVKRALERARDDGLHSKVYINNGTYTETSRMDHGYGEDMSKVLVIEGQSRTGVKITVTATGGGYIYFAANKSNVVFRNLTFDNCNNAIFNLGQWEPISGARYFLIEGCDFTNNGAGDTYSIGLNLLTVRDLTIKNCKFNNNYGVALNVIGRDVLVEDSEFINNCRTAPIDDQYADRDTAAGFSVYNAAFRRCKFNSNKRKGMRFDHSSELVSIENCEMNDNGFLGLQIEISKGPVTVKNCTIARNPRGVQLETAQGTTFDTCTFEDNTNSAVYITWKNRDKLRGDPDTFSNGAAGNLNKEPGNNWTYEQALYGTRRTKFRGCTFKTTKGAGSFFYRKRPEDTQWGEYRTWYVDEFTGEANDASKANSYYNSAATNVFEISNGSNNGAASTDLNGWKSATGSDSSATWNGSGTTTPPPASGANLASNPSFESEQYGTQTPSGWSTWAGMSGSNADADYTETNGGGQSGSYHGTHYKWVNYELSTYQIKTGLANGNYTLKAWVKSSGGQPTAQLYAKNFGGSQVSANANTAMSTWTQLTISNINVTNGQCEIGFYTYGNANQWMYFDTVEFYKQ